MAGASHYDGIKKQVSRNDQLEEDKKTVKVDKLILTIPGSITFLFIEYVFCLLLIRWLWWEMVLWARLASALFIHRSRNFYTDYQNTTQIIIRIITILHGLYISLCFPQKTFPTSYNPTVFDTYPTDMVLADPEKTVSYQMLVSS